jgi:hypothetical protein
MTQCGLCAFFLVEFTTNTTPNAHHFECHVACMHQIEHMQHASQIPNGLGRSSCEGFFQQCWILAENLGPSCS